MNTMETNQQTVSNYHTPTYVVQASPLTRIFLPEWHHKCLENPELLRSTEPFDIRIPRAAGAIELTHGVPTLSTTLIQHSKTRVVDNNEVAPLVAWLTGESCEETDQYGVVAVPIQTSVSDAIMSLLYEKSEDHQIKLLRETRKRIADGIKNSRDIADARVSRACKKMYGFVKNTVEMMKKEGKGVYTPSYAEALAFEIIKDQISKQKAPEKRATEMVNNIVSSLENPV